MIWLWIFLAVAVTALLLRGKKIEPYNFVWALIPIDRYGITLLGFTFKPVYILSGILIMYSLITKKNRIKMSSTVFITTMLLGILVVVSSLLRNDSNVTTDLKLYALFFFTIACAAGIMSMLKGKDDLRQIKDVIIATAVGYGIVFLGLSALDSIGITLPAVKESGFREDSIIKIYNNVKDGVLIQSQRLRGFYLDANISSVSFLVSFAVLLGDWIKKGHSIRNIIYAVIITANIVLTSSRTALIIWLAVIIISVFRLFFAKVQSKQKILFIGAVLILLFCITLIFIYNSNILDRIYETLITRYFNRSGLTDDNGRFTIWKDALSSLTADNWYCGLGTDELIESTIPHDAHNTFIQATCGNGVFFGLFYTLYFLYPLICALRHRITDHKNTYSVSTFAIVYLCILAISSTVSHICSIYLIYTAFLLLMIPRLLNEDTQN